MVVISYELELPLHARFLPLVDKAFLLSLK